MLLSMYNSQLNLLIILGPGLKAQGSRADQLAAHQGTRPRDQEIFFNYLIDIAPIISYIVIDWFGDPNR